jgi:hypothetical protein
MLRHAGGFALANKGHDTLALQAYLGHRNIQRTVRYTELSQGQCGALPEREVRCLGRSRYPAARPRLPVLTRSDT